MPARFAGWKPRDETGWKPGLRRLTPLRVTVTILDEYRTPPRGDTFDSKPHAKERSRKDHGGFESTPHD